MTVGPLPPAVYWRRRAVLLAAVFLILFGFSRCVMSAFGDERPGSTAAQTPSATPSPSDSAEPDTSAGDPGGESPGTAVGGDTGDGGGAPDDGGAMADPAGAPGDPAPGAAVEPAAPVPGPDRPCGPGELVVTASPERTEYKVGTMPRLRLTVRNAAATACTTDLGATRQELRVTSGGARIWSSDDCNPTRGSDVVVLAPGAQRTFTMTWSGKTSTPKCSTVRVRAGAGTYRVWARLGGTLSAPVVFRLV